MSKKTADQKNVFFTSPLKSIWKFRIRLGYA